MSESQRRQNDDQGMHMSSDDLHRQNYEQERPSDELRYSNGPFMVFIKFIRLATT